MTDEMVGTWIGDARSATGFKEYFDSIGKSDQFSSYNTNYVVVFTKTGDNEYATTKHIEGLAEALVENFKIGQKGQYFFPGFGHAESTISLEGNKLVRTSNSRGTPLKSVLYVEGNTMVFEFTAGNKTAVLRLQKSRAESVQ